MWSSLEDRSGAALFKSNGGGFESLWTEYIDKDNIHCRRDPECQCMEECALKESIRCGEVYTGVKFFRFVIEIDQSQMSDGNISSTVKFD